MLGTGPLAAVGSTGSITFLIIGFCLGLCSGFAIPVAQRFGSRDYKELRRFIGNAVWLCVGFGIVLTVLTVIFCRNILELMGTPADIIDDAYAYLVVIFAGIPATFLYNMLAGIPARHRRQPHAGCHPRHRVHHQYCARYRPRCFHPHGASQARRSQRSLHNSSAALYVSSM